jgi:hypothetical protein
MATSVATEQRIELLGMVELLHDHLTTSLCQTVFHQTRTTHFSDCTPLVCSCCLPLWAL